MEVNQFFGHGGLTSTEANHVANLAKEAYAALEADLANTSFINTHIKLLSGGESFLLRQGLDVFETEDLQDKIVTIAKHKALIAWLREAMKEKERMLKTVKDMSAKDYCNKFGVEFPAPPKRNTVLTESDWMNNLSIKDRNRFLTVEAYCSSFGKFIHPDGAFSIAKSELERVNSKPNSISGTGSDTTITSKTPSVDISEVSEVSVALQEEYRKYQAELNSFKHRRLTAIEKSEIEVTSSYELDSAEYDNAYNRIVAQCRDYQLTETSKIGKLKIIIPNDLKDTYEQLSK